MPKIDLQDDTRGFSSLGDRLSLTELMSVGKGSVVIKLDGKSRECETGTVALATLTEKYQVKK